MDDELDLLHRLAAGDRAAFGRFYTAHAERVYHTALGYVRDAALAEEIVQDVFVRIYRGGSAFDGRSAVRTWVYRITVNAALSAVDKRKRAARFRAPTEGPEPIDFDHPGVALERREEARLLFRVIDRLPERQRTAFILGFVEELPRAEIATILDVSLKSVESLLQRAKQNLRSQLRELYPDRGKKTDR